MMNKTCFRCLNLASLFKLGKIKNVDMLSQSSQPNETLNHQEKKIGVANLCINHCSYSSGNISYLKQWMQNNSK